MGFWEVVLFSGVESNISTTVMNVLSHGTRLQNGAFVVGKVLGQGGFGITYHGADVSLRRYVAIKEFFLSDCVRNGMQVIPGDTLNYTKGKIKFLEEARILARFNYYNIVNVLNAFEENDTAYMVMEFLKGKTLQQLVEERGCLTEGEAIKYIEQISEALERVHEAGLIHRDIKPENIIVCHDSRVVLIDFGLHKEIEVTKGYGTRRLTSTTRLGTEGYAPPEQYLQHGPTGIFTDIYALGATFYFLLTGQAPISAPERAMGGTMLPPQRLNPSISPAANSAVLSAMEIKSEQRPQTTRDFVNSLRPRIKPISAITSVSTSGGVIPSHLSIAVKRHGYCPTCGGANSHNNLACGYCGARLPWATQPSTPTIMPLSVPVVNPTPPIPLAPLPTVKQASGARLTHTPSYNLSGFSTKCPHCFISNNLPYFDNPNMIFTCYSCKQAFSVIGLKPSSRPAKTYSGPHGCFERALMLLLVFGAFVPALFLVGMIVGFIPCLIISSIIGSNLSPLVEIITFGCGFGAAGWFVKSLIEDRTLW